MKKHLRKGYPVVYQGDEWLVHHQFIEHHKGFCRNCGRGLNSEEEYKLKLCRNCYKRAMNLKH
ncbi:MAG: hypothetical protein H0Z32_05025 [Bacillaceae bacterium]|nr:hypothetical protein [Bacillaceae bacterium]